MNERVIDYLGIGFIISCIVCVAALFILETVEANTINDNLQKQYVQACNSNGGVVVDNACFDPIKLEEAKLHIPTG